MPLALPVEQPTFRAAKNKRSDKSRGTAEALFRLMRQFEESGVNSYFCIVNMPGVPAREICVLDAADDASAIKALDAVEALWIGFDTICLYQGERFIKVLSNPALGFPRDGLALPHDLDQAA
ncbi:hypothetical protein [Brevundimonas sp. CEF1]|uniref:hypothetical protein n=1 Tax=Brevundimonas sp. CEF1 TaxID=3442642 RepID=UPI003F50F33A